MMSMQSKRVLRCPQVKTRTGLSRSTIYAKLDPGNASFDPSFPKQIPIGLRAVGWIESEIDEWIASLRRTAGNDQDVQGGEK